tara:strand:+ start:61 stop:606 length:546 start_codon:yes stop_codon:yes gene_type:complete
LKTIVAIGGSSSSNSINRRFANYAARSVSSNVNIVELDLNDFNMPIYSEDLHKSSGIPQEAINFKKEIYKSDGIVISLAEHNGSYTAAFKNIYDWISVIESDVWCSKPILLLSTSTGSRGGQTVLKSAHERFSLNYKYYIPCFSLPNFNQNFDSNNGILDVRLNQDFQQVIIDFENILNGD